MSEGPQTSREITLPTHSIMRNNELLFFELLDFWGALLGCNR